MIGDGWWEKFDSNSGNLYYVSTTGKPTVWDWPKEVPTEDVVANNLAQEMVIKNTPLRIDDAYQCEFFNQAVDQKTGYKTTSVLAVPVRSTNGEVLGALQVINKIQEQLAHVTKAAKDYAIKIASIKHKVSLEVSADRMISKRISTENMQKVIEEAGTAKCVALGQAETRHHAANINKPYAQSTIPSGKLFA